MTQTERRFNCQTCQWETVELPLNHGWQDRYDAEAERIDRRRMERDGWETVCWDGR
jgi:hypothetical protein